MYLRVKSECHKVRRAWDISPGRVGNAELWESDGSWRKTIKERKGQPASLPQKLHFTS
jgi:hypothetical protein